MKGGRSTSAYPGPTRLFRGTPAAVAPGRPDDLFFNHVKKSLVGSIHNDTIGGGGLFP
jgi:hypothetical protein